LVVIGRAAKEPCQCCSSDCDLPLVMLTVSPNEDALCQQVKLIVSALMLFALVMPAVTLIRPLARLL